MAAYWANFVKSGDPNGHALPDWPRYETSAKLVMELGEEPAAKPVPDVACLSLLSGLLAAE